MKTRMATAFAVGSAIGAGAALLYAPVSGRRMRHMLRREAKGYWDVISKKSHDVSGECRNFVNGATRFIKNPKIVNAR